MPNYGQRTVILILKNNIMIMDKGVHVVRLNRISLYSGVHCLDTLVTPEEPAFLLQIRSGILHLSAMLLKALDCRSAPYPVPGHPL